MAMNEDRAERHREVSAGGVVYRNSGAGTEVLLIRSSRDTDAEKWTFPKGWTGDHGNETLEETALREVREEGGVNTKIVLPLGEVKYSFNWRGQPVAKTVHYFLMEYLSGDPADHDDEVAEARWVPVGDAEAMLVYNSDKDIFERALRGLGA